MTDIELSAILLEKLGSDDAEARRAIVGGPFTVRAKAVLLPGYALDYEIRLRNISSDCDCLPSVDIVGARFLPES